MYLLGLVTVLHAIATGLYAYGIYKRYRGIDHDRNTV